MRPRNLVEPLVVVTVALALPMTAHGYSAATAHPVMAASEHASHASPQRRPPGRARTAQRSSGALPCPSKRTPSRCEHTRRDVKRSSPTSRISRSRRKHDRQPPPPSSSSSGSDSSGSGPSGSGPSGSGPSGSSSSGTGTSGSGSPGSGSSGASSPAEAPAGATPPSSPGGSIPPSDPASPVQAPTLSITGTTYYVSPSGSDSNSGTSPSSPWRTVKRVNEAQLRPGDGVLFQGGSTFSDETLMPADSGAAGSPIVFGSYGSGNAILPLGVWFKEESYFGFEHLTISSGGNLQGTGNDVAVEWCTVEDTDHVGIDAMGAGWTIDDNTLDKIGDSGMLLEGEDDTIAGNTITNTGLDGSIPYGKHGIYLKVIDATVTHNTIVNFSADGISARYRNSTISENYISGGPIGIAWFQYDPTAGTSHWTANTILATTEVGIYVSPSNIGGSTRESFVIEDNTIEPAGGGFTNLAPTSGSYTVQANTLL
jgi:hypothetical protein